MIYQHVRKEKQDEVFLLQQSRLMFILDKSKHKLNTQSNITST